jgi:hypothetical protein
LDDLPKKTEKEKQASVVREIEAKRKQALLEGMYVRVKRYRLSETETGTYHEAYQKIIFDIQEEQLTT